MLKFRTILGKLLAACLIFTHLSCSSVEQNNWVLGFGSCAMQNKEQKIWSKIHQHEPNVFILMGDNVYIDSNDSAVMQREYQRFNAIPSFSSFREQTQIIGTWDDHDYGLNDGGKYFDAKHEAKNAFIQFFNYPEVNQLATHQEGIQHVVWQTVGQHTVQIILLDTRWYRDDIPLSSLAKKERRKILLGPYTPNTDPKSTLLGQAQWEWLESELKKPATLKLLVSSIQVLPEYTGWESWANFPHERKKLLAMINQYAPDNLLILSGDVHRAEVSKIVNHEKPLYELTSSGLAAKIFPAAPNKHRVNDALIQQNFGLLTFQSEATHLSVNATIRNDNDDIYFEQSFQFPTL